MPLPSTRSALVADGWELRSTSKCRSCAAAIEWWQKPGQKITPMNPMSFLDAPAVSHFATCPDANKHRKNTRHDYAPSAPQATAAQKIDAHQKYLAAFRASSNARVIIAIYDDGTAAAWRKGLAGEDLRHELITEANNLRNYIAQEN